jgi:alpha-tubulin suppressor-like RCC1 family protein
MGTELGPMVPFFPEFRKIDPFGQKQKVIDVAYGAASVHILAEDGNGTTTYHAAGDNEWGQLGNGTTLQTHVMQQISIDQ